MRRCLCVLVLAPALLAAGCGGGSGFASNSEYCDHLNDVAEAAKKTTTTSASSESAMAKYDKVLAEITDKAPTQQVKDDYEVVHKYIRLYVAASAPKADQTEFNEFKPTADAATERIAKYNKDTCKFRATTTTAK